MNKQEFLNGQIVLFNGDCLDVMRDLKDGEIDLVLTDPPYGGAGNDWQNKKNSRFGGWFKKYEIKATRTGGTWANKYESKVKHWDIAPEQEIFDAVLEANMNLAVVASKIGVYPSCGIDIVGVQEPCQPCL